jgi:hypothetical protein
LWSTGGAFKNWPVRPSFPRPRSEAAYQRARSFGGNKLSHPDFQSIRGPRYDRFSLVGEAPGQVELTTSVNVEQPALSGPDHAPSTVRQRHGGGGSTPVPRRSADPDICTSWRRTIISAASSCLSSGSPKSVAAYRVRLMTAMISTMDTVGKLSTMCRVRCGQSVCDEQQR